MYELFVGPPELDSEWDDRGIEGVYRFISRFWNLVLDNADKNTEPTQEMIRLRHKMIHDITFRLENFSLNTVVSGFMEFNNKMIEMNKAGGIDKETLETAIILLAPFTPHLSEELWRTLGHQTSVFENKWPIHDEKMMEETEKKLLFRLMEKLKLSSK